MHYNYDCGNETIRVFVWNDNFHTTVDVEDATTRKCYERTIREDEKGKFFTWNKHKIYLDDWKRTSMKSIVEKLENKERIFDDMLVIAILSEGVENVRFEIPMPYSDGFFKHPDKTTPTICRIDEEYRDRKVKNNYKIALTPVEPQENLSLHEEYYISDFAGLIECGYIKVVLEK